MVNSPRIDPISLPELADGDLSNLMPRAVVEAAWFVAVDIVDVDLTDAVLTECALDRVSISDSQLRGIRVSETSVTVLNAPVLAAARSTWREVTISGSRLGSAELFEADFSGVRITGSKIGYLNLRSATLTNVIIEDCTIDELDLGGAVLKLVAFVDCQVGTLDVTRTRFTDTDLRGTHFSSIVGIGGLRGATVDESQLSTLAPHLAAAAGIRVE